MIVLFTITHSHYESSKPVISLLGQSAKTFFFDSIQLAHCGLTIPTAIAVLVPGYRLKNQLLLECLVLVPGLCVLTWQFRAASDDHGLRNIDVGLRAVFDLVSLSLCAIASSGRCAGLRDVEAVVSKILY